MRTMFGVVSDVFAILLLVWISIASIVLNNTGKGNPVASATPTESNLPSIRLPRGKSKGLETIATTKAVTLSATKDGNRIQYFVDETPLSFQELASTLSSKQVVSVKIRFDRQIPYGDYVKVLDLCKEVGVKDITNVYTTENLIK